MKVCSALSKERETWLLIVADLAVAQLEAFSCQLHVFRRGILRHCDFVKPMMMFQKRKWNGRYHITIIIVILIVIMKIKPVKKRKQTRQPCQFFQTLAKGAYSAHCTICKLDSWAVYCGMKTRARNKQN